MTDAAVSVIMSTYNCERYVREAIDSILSQTFSDFEFIIIDDGSTDATWDILASFDDPRVRPMRNEANVGLTRSLNKGLARARGVYIARQDADDVSLPERLERQVEVLDSSQRLGLVSSSYTIIDPAGRILRRMHLPTTDAEIRSRLLQGNPFCHGAAMFRKDCLSQVGAYRARFGAAQDYDLWLRIAEEFDVANLGELLYCWRLRPESATLSDIKRQLAFSRLAQILAMERRSTVEDPRPQALEEVELPEPDAWLLAMSNLSFGVLLYAADSAHLAVEYFRAAVVHTPDVSPGWVRSLATALTTTTALQKDAVPDLLGLLVKISKDIRPARPAHRRMVAEIHCAGALYYHNERDRASMVQHLRFAVLFHPASLVSRITASMLLEIVLGRRVADRARWIWRSLLGRKVP